jgi:hypothetical protein
MKKYFIAFFSNYIHFFYYGCAFMITLDILDYLISRGLSLPYRQTSIKIYIGILLPSIIVGCKGIYDCWQARR